MMPRPQTLIRIALGVILLAVVSHTRADPDLWGHVLFGRDIVSSRSIPETDSYSFMSDRMWINHEWLAECVMYIAYAIGGAPGLVMLKMFVVLTMLALVWGRLGRRQVDTASRDLLIALAVIGTFPQANHVRPQIFSIVAFAVLMWILDSGGSVRRLLLIPLVFAAWINFHGGWIVGGGVLAMWAVLTAAGPSPGRGASSDASGARQNEESPPRWWQGEKGLLFLVGAMAFAGTLANPYGWRMWLFLTSTVGFGRAEITDWQPLYRLGMGYVALWAVLALAAAIGAIHAWRSRTWELRRLGVVLILGLASFQVSRLQAFFAIAVVLLLGRDIAAALIARRGGGIAGCARAQATGDSVGHRHRGGSDRRWRRGVGQQPDVYPYGIGPSRARGRRHGEARPAAGPAGRLVRLGRVRNLALRAGAERVDRWQTRDRLHRSGHAKASELLLRARVS